MGSKLKSLTRWSIAPAKNVETALTPRVNVLRGLAARATTPLLPDDYLKLLNPLWTARELRGEVVDVRNETEDSATVTIKPGWGFSADYQPGQYVGIGLRVDGRWHWRSYSLTSVPRRDEKRITITVKATPEGFLSTHLVNGVKPGTIVRLAAPKGDFALPDPPPPKILFVSAGSGITPLMAMLRSLKARGHDPDIVHVHSAPSADAVIFHDELRELEATQPGYRLHLQLTQADGTARLRAASTTWCRTGGSGPPGRAVPPRCSTRSRRCGTTLDVRGRPAHRAIRHRAHRQGRRGWHRHLRDLGQDRSTSTAPLRFWRPARRSGSRCRSAAGWASARPACCPWNPVTSVTSVPANEHGEGDRINTCVSTASGDCTLKI